MKLNVGDTAYQCRNSSYVFESFSEIDEAIDEVYVVTILRSYKGKTQYLVRVTSEKERGFEHEQSEEKLYQSKMELTNKLIEENIEFLEQLTASAKHDIAEARRVLKRNEECYEHNIEKYAVLIKKMKGCGEC
jgi:hypothetical protein